MYENPLLPNAKLRELYSLMLQHRKRSVRSRKAAHLSLEAVGAATQMHLLPGDIISALPRDLLTEALAADHGSFFQPLQHRLAVVAGAAFALRQARTGNLALAFTWTGTAMMRADAGWQESVTYATRETLPLLLVCVDIRVNSRKTANPDAITWTTMSRLAKSLRLPILSVDGMDAVAMYRVMQEASLRARTVGGTAVIWCSVPGKDARSLSTDPLRHMKNYLKVRNLLPLPKKARE